ncbi:MAG: hypothetical protein K5686_07935 [Lachnospiraceae bacterium]|nr:hypothetical protein [Lachnospiraceae bacterium]
MAKRSRRKKNRILKAVIVIAAASLILACTTIAVFTISGRKAKEPAQPAKAEENEMPESGPEAVREVVSLEIPGEQTENTAEEETTAAEDDEDLQTADETTDAETAEAAEPEEEELNTEEAEIKEESAESEEPAAEETVLEESVPEDKSAPCFLSFTAAPLIKAGEAFDIHRYVGYADDVDREVQIAINGEVDVNTVGKYPLEIVLADDAGHMTSRNMEVNVLAELPPPGPSETKSEAFSDFVSAYKNEQTSVGIDISRWQETVDFEKVKAAGCEFVYIRIGGLDDGELYTDRYYQNNIAGARACGLKVGIYWHAEESSAEEVKASVAYLLNVLGGEKPDLPIAYDWEDFKNFENYGMNLQDINDNAKLFADELEAHGYSACLYSSKFFLEKVWNASAAPVWLAHYTKATSYAGQYFMWQHSCTGKIDGIAGDVDLDVLYDGRL